MTIRTWLPALGACALHMPVGTWGIKTLSASRHEEICLQVFLVGAHINDV